jgi:hypothetical protein
MNPPQNKQPAPPQPAFRTLPHIALLCGSVTPTPKEATQLLCVTRETLTLPSIGDKAARRVVSGRMVEVTRTRCEASATLAGHGTPSFFLNDGPRCTNKQCHLTPWRATKSLRRMRRGMLLRRMLRPGRGGSMYSYATLGIMRENTIWS